MTTATSKTAPWGDGAFTDDDLVLWVSDSGRCLSVSSTVTSMLGYPPATMVGRSLCEVLVPQDRPTIRAVQQALRRDGRARTTIQVHRADGTTAWLDVAGKCTGGVGADGVSCITARDVTDDMLAVTGLAESEHRWRLAFDHSPLGAALVGVDGTIRLANDALGGCSATNRTCCAPSPWTRSRCRPTRAPMLAATTGCSPGN